MNDKEIRRASRFLVLRHDRGRVGLDLDPQGWSGSRPCSRAAAAPGSA
ncbi:MULTISPECIES: hypothetical protein [unclassified Nocardiopsis]|nr:hypothetical protein [Nocardiopsis sp. B62]